MGVNNIDFSTQATIEATVINLATGVAPTMPERARGAVISVGANALRYRDDGTDPTASVGHLLNVGDVLTFDSWTVPKQNWRSVMKNVNFIQAVASTTGNIMVSWYD